MKNKHHPASRKQLSFSQIQKFQTCPYSFYLSYELPKEKKKDIPQQNIFSAFGNSAHKGIESELTFQSFDFEKDFYDRLKKFNEVERQKTKELKDYKKLYRDMVKIGPKLINEAINFLNEKYSKAEIIGIEKIIKHPINENLKFKGILDLAIKEQNKIKLIDWKSCSWGWDAKKRSDKMVLYQLTLYKYFYCEQNEINPEDVDASFVLLKRTGKPKQQVEEIKITTGKKRTNNALKIVEDCGKNIYVNKKPRYKKVGEHCRKCSFNATKHCPGLKG